ncbi:peptidase aspartic [Paraphoma chrysanthemicola]|uniref:Peptidase aspartic n=1 Tax=Paraphoma chrysanthemicola TaxID=798071 RepID=A0A8K0R2C8_9PLEO|nr:peptidase aspartic [Paraphoma chrysanthemicola]
MTYTTAAIIPRRPTLETLPGDKKSRNHILSQQGNDGPWSSFVLQVGNKSQEVRVLPSTASSSTWVIYENPGCNNVPLLDCPASRGKTFQPNSSSTHSSVSLQGSIYELGIEENLLGRIVNGDYGIDSVTLGYPGGGGATVSRSVIAGIGDTHFTWLGVLGLNPRPVNFSTTPNAPKTSFVQSLKDQGDIPSLAWAYTAGARYKSKPIFGSLVFGGFNPSRFEKPVNTDPELTFPFYTDVERDLLVAVTSISTSNTTQSSSPAKLLSEGIYALIDSTVPHIWLPEIVCGQFESAFGLEWENDTELYKLSKAQHDTLLATNPSVTMTISPTLDASTTRSINITFPYSAFDMNVSWPFGGGPSKNESAYYFPLKRAKSANQYTLGRAFLQEAYVIADYERQNFSVWPCKWDESTMNDKVVTILPRGEFIGSDNSGRRKGLGGGAIAGIAVGCVAVVFILGLWLWLHWRRRGRVQTQSSESTESAREAPDQPDSPLSPLTPQLKKYPLVTELAGTSRHELHEDHRFEAESGGKFELDGQGMPYEVEGVEKGVLYEMDAGGDGVGLVDSHGELVRITVEPATALSPRPGSVLPSPISDKSTESMGASTLDDLQSQKEQSRKTTQAPKSGVDVVETPGGDEKDGVRSFFGFLKAFRASGRS